VGIVWLSLKSDRIAHDEALTRVPTLFRAKCTSDGKIRFVYHAGPQPRRITPGSTLPACGNHGLALRLALGGASSLECQFPFCGYAKANVLREHPFNGEGEVIQFIFGDVTIERNLFNNLV
jgi:hypothetical protein